MSGAAEVRALPQPTGYGRANTPSSPKAKGEIKMKKQYIKNPIPEAVSADGTARITFVPGGEASSETISVPIHYEPAE